MSGVKIIIPGEPTAKGRPRIGRAWGRAIAFTPQKTRTREGIIAALAMEAMKGSAPFDGPVQLTLTAFFSVPASWSKAKRAAALSGAILPAKRPDLDNIVKAATDALNGIVYLDDAQICAVMISKLYAERAETVIHVSGCGGGA